MSERMQVVRVVRPGHVILDHSDRPTPRPTDVLVRVSACGICGTDLHIIDGEFPPAPYPLVPGHEFAGVVVDIGADVTGLDVGDRVAVDPSLFCGRCRYCHMGRGNLCTAWAAIGDTRDGAFAEYVAVPMSNAHPIPDHLSDSAAALVEPLSCAVHGLDRLAPVPGERVAVLGAGTMGLLLGILLRRAGAALVGLADPRPHRLERARALGLNDTVDSVADLRSMARDGFDAVVDATGVPAVIEQGLDLVGRGGRFMVFGVAPAGVSVSIRPFTIYNHEITIVGSMAVLNSFRRALDLMAEGLVDASQLVSQSIPLEGFEEALASARSGRGLKVQLTP